MNKKILLPIILVTVLIVVFFYFFTSSETKPSEIKWSKTFGGIGDDEGYFVLSTNDGGCIVLGYTKTEYNEFTDIYLIKIDENGDKEWDKTYGGDGSEYGKAMLKLDNGYVIAGTSNSEGFGEFDYNAWLIKIDLSGNILWNKTYGGIYEDSANSIVETQNGDYIITGSKYSYSSRDLDLWVFKVNKTGDTIWSKTFGGTGFDEGRSIVQADDGYVITGETNSYSKNDDYSDAWLLKVNTTGDHVWNKTFDGLGFNDLFNQIIETDSGFIIVGHTQNITLTFWAEYYSNGYIVITDENGETLSERIFEDDEETGISSVEKADDGYIVTGYIGPYGTGEGDIIVEKIDNIGNRIWLKNYGGDYSDAGVWIDRGTGNNYFVTGYQDFQGTGFKDLWLAKLELE